MKCLNCKESFTPQRNGQSVCGFECSIEYQKKQREKKRKKEEKEWKQRKKALKKKVKTLGEHKSDLQDIFNPCIRKIDEGYPCISCGADKPSDAGHYRSRGAYPELRFDPFNVYLQCRSCNGYKGGKGIEIREGLIDRYGKEAAEAFLEPTRPFGKLTINDIEELKKVVRRFLKYLKQEDKLYSIEETIQLRHDLLIEMQKAVN